ncbi:P-loop containing nucleoside triphosphate hydrolase protein [Zopfochytrium polystomum]|nr:P-loop containing nucleoside triphosphate hydrolase protein [Zopfochytrium polystomum]
MAEESGTTADPAANGNDAPTDRNQSSDESRPTSRGPAADVKTWEALNLRSDWIAALNKVGILEPTVIQRKSFNVIANGNNCILRAETGSGKTLAYLIPLLARLVPSTLDVDVRRASPLSPTIMIFTQTEELCHQLVAQFKALPSLGLKCTVIPPPVGVPVSALSFPDVGVATPDTFVRYHRNKSNLHELLARTEGVVFDEADATTITPRSRKLINDMLKIRSLRKRGSESDRPRPFQFVFSAATLPSGNAGGQTNKDVVTYLQSTIPEVTTVDSDLAHHLSPRLVQNFVNLVTLPPRQRDIPKYSTALSIAPFAVQAYRENTFREKLDLLFCAIAERPKREPNAVSPLPDRWIVFCNDRDATERVHGAINLAVNQGDIPRGVSVKFVHAELDDDARSSVIARFARPLYDAAESSGVPDLDILVATDVASRGIDFERVAVVVNFDFPTNAVDYMHRAGRTARIGRPGMVLSFVAAENAPLASRIRRVGKGSFADAAGGDGRGVFSRKRSLSKKGKRMEGKQAASAKSDAQGELVGEGAPEELEAPPRGVGDAGGNHP